MALRIGVDLHLFHILNDKHGRPVSADELAKEAKSEVLLIGTEFK